MTTTQKFVELATKNIQIGYVRFNPDRAVHIRKLSEVVNFKIKKVIESHPSVITTDWDSNLSTIRVFTKQIKGEFFYPGHSNYMEFISNFISNENILKFKIPQFLVIDPVYQVKRDWISITDKGYNSQLFIEYVEANYEEIIHVIRSNPVDSVRLFEFLEKMN